MLVAIVKKELRIEHHSLYNVLQIFSISMFEKVTVNQLLTNAELERRDIEKHKQLLLFDL